MINDIRWLLKSEQPLDAWIMDVMAVVNDACYEIFMQLNQALDGVDKNVC